MQVRRGADRAGIYSLAFSATGQWLAASSDKGTVHVFGLNFNTKSPGNDNSQCASGSNLAVTQPRSFRSIVRGEKALFLFPFLYTAVITLRISILLFTTEVVFGNVHADINKFFCFGI